MKANKLILALFLMLPLRLFAQSNEVFFTELSEGWKLGNTNRLSQLLDERVTIIKNGKEKSYSREEASAELLRFFGANRPVSFSLRHRGTSADGQLYLIGHLNTQGGGNFKIVCRARTFPSGYRIFKLDMESFTEM